MHATYEYGLQTVNLTTYKGRQNFVLSYETAIWESKTTLKPE